MKELSIKEALEYRKSNKLKIGDNCLSIDTFEGDKYVDCPYREQNCQNKICAKYMAHLDVNDDKIVQKEIENMGFDMNNMQMFELLMSMQSLFAEKFHKVKGLSKEEQDKIANFFSLIDNKISLQSEKVEALKDYKKGIMQKIFSRELRFKDDEGRDYPEWEERKLGDICTFFSGGTPLTTKSN